MAKYEVSWDWEDAFSKFGFEEERNCTDQVVDVIESLGYECETGGWGCHSLSMIRDVKKAGVSIMPETVNMGYDDPRTWLPPDVIARLDEKFKD